MLSDVLVRRYSAAPVAQRSGLATDAEATIAQALKLDPANVAALTSLVDLRLSSGASRDELAGTLKKLIPVTEGKMSPAASLWTARAAVENALGDHNSAKTSIARAIELDPSSSASMFVAADIALADDLDRAKHLSAALASKNADPARLAMLNAKIAAAEGRSADAVAFLDKVPPSPATDELRREIASSVVSDPSELEKLLAAGPPNPALLGRLCSAYRRNDPVKALAYCKRASEADPNNLTPAAGYAAALVQAKDFTAAVSMLRRLLEIAPDNSTLHANLATALFELKDYPAAQKEFEWLSNSDAKAAAPYFFLGIIHDRAEEYVDALGAYEQYLRLADPVANKLDIDKVELRLPTLRRLVKEGKGKRVRS
jgi:tetratricopeptide (TPR) repeat protein